MSEKEQSKSLKDGMTEKVYNVRRFVATMRNKSEKAGTLALCDAIDAELDNILFMLQDTKE